MSIPEVRPTLVDWPISPLHGAQDDAEQVVSINHWNPHGYLGAHAADGVGGGVVFRAFEPGAASCELLLSGRAPISMERIHSAGLFAALVSAATLPVAYRLRFRSDAGGVWERDDPYRFLPTLGELDLHLFNEGAHRQLWEVLGARPIKHQGVDGVAFAVWAPNARRVSVVGDFCQWDGRRYCMRQLGHSGVFELFVPDLKRGECYKYEIKTQTGALRLKSDPLGAHFEVRPNTASRVYASNYVWGDSEWIRKRSARDVTRAPMAIYELHLGSWARVPEEGHRFLSYREIAPHVVAHVKRLGFNYVELMPACEHPLDQSWGYQVTGYFAPTSRYGEPDDFRFFVDYCHQHGVGVIVDWVPAHFPKDDFALAYFDGTHLYEHSDPRLGEHPDWGTLIFNYGRREVRGFLIASALCWLKSFHIDGLRVDAVASMIYLDYSRQPGQWIPNCYGGNENFDAINLLRDMNRIVAEDYPGCFTAAEESTAFAGVTRPASEGGLGFTFKWNMGWMHDTLLYMSKDPIHRRFHHGQLSFAMVYEYHERFIMPLSHDEVVHGKRSLLARMPGDHWQRMANLRLLFAYQFTRPGKKLVFMGSELAPYDEWHSDHSLPWHLADDPERTRLQVFLEDLGQLYHENPCFWQDDHLPQGFSWVSFDDAENCVLAYCRWANSRGAIVVLNFTPVPRDDYRIGAPKAGRYREWLNSDAQRYAGSGYQTVEAPRTQPAPAHGLEQSLVLRLPPLGALVLGWEGA